MLFKLLLICIFVENNKIMKTLKICLVGIFLSTSYSNAQSIVSITPNSVQPGQVLNALITGSGTSFLNGPGITNTRLNLGGSIIPSDSASINTIDNLHFTASFSIPSTGIPLGIYDLSVEVFDSVAGFPIIYNLSQAVTVGTIDGYITGQAYEDLNQNGVKDPAEQGLANVGIHNMPSNYSTLTDSLGNYSFSVANGNYTISCVDSSITDYLFSTSSPSYNVIINNNNSASNDFGLRRGLLSVAPSVVIQDETANFTVVSDSIFQTSSFPFGNINTAEIIQPGGSSISYSATISSIHVINNNILNFSISIPYYAVPGLYDLIIYTNPPFLGGHKLPGCIAVIAAPSKVEGKFYFDSNANGIYDSIVDIPMPSQSVLLMPNNKLGVTNMSGDFSILTSNGNKTLTCISPPGFILSTTPSTYNLNVTNSIATNNDFGFQAGTPNYDGTLSISGSTRCFTQSDIHFNFNNKSNLIVNGVLGVYFSSNLSANNPNADFISGDTLFWNISNLNLFASFAKTINFNIPGPLSNIEIYSFVRLTNGANVEYIDSANSKRTVTCSFDPNDKAVYPTGVQSENYTLMNDRLFYTIRFQNTGNDTAFFVQVRDLLDPQLNLSTFRLESFSHSVNTSLELNTRALIFTFNNILLPDSNVNEPLSHGYVIYSIEVESGLADATQITNTANIYFDSNEPVVTNTTLNTMVYSIPVGLNETNNENFNVIVMPNPATENALLRFDNIKNKSYKLSLYSLIGKLVFSHQTNSGEIVISLKDFTSGIYIYHLTPDGEGKTYKGKLIVK